MTCLAIGEGQHHRLYHVGHIDEGEILRTVAHTEVCMSLDALGHEELVALARTVYSRGAQDDVWQLTCQTLEITLGLEFAATIGRVRTGSIFIGNVGIGIILMYGTHDAEAAHKHETLQWHGTVYECQSEIMGAHGIDGMEIIGIGTLGGSSGVHHMTEPHTASLLAHRTEGFGHLKTVGEIKIDEMNARVAEPLAAARGAHRRPYLIALRESLVYNITADETSSTSNKQSLGVVL